MSISSIKRALVSVSDKSGIVEFSRELSKFGIEILSTGGTTKLLRDQGIRVQEVSSYTGFPEILNGRVKTLHPKIHGGILSQRLEADQAILDLHGIEPIDLVVVNLYPFEDILQKEGVSEAEIIEHIDIGGPTLLRSAAKNFQYVTAVTENSDYSAILSEIRAYGGTTLELRRRLAFKVFRKTSHYDQAIADFFHGNGAKRELLDLHYEKVLSLRYGENPHQKAAFFRDLTNDYPNVTNARILQGKQLSYNNILDTDSAIKIVQDFDRPTAAVIKHTNPCGVASAETIAEAFEKAYLCDPKSSFGCIIALNRPCDKEIVKFFRKHKMFVEIVVAPSFSEKACSLLSKKNDLRLLATGDLRINPKERDIKSVGGGILVQNMDFSDISRSDLKIVTRRVPTDEQMTDLLFARKIAKHVKSNAVVFAKNEVTTGIGAGQMSRVDSVFIAGHKALDRAKDSVMASDAFFPFADGVTEAWKAGITAIIQPGGSIRDAEVIAKADELGIAMVFTGVRSFKH
ncbi:bifunctional phosphoribosylaminoimidazolecarboxamide formyltransferase/IMP cyclohydrolase [Candidatus Peregrinibacteria bacterium]|nr:bifunctional phosphoribosylaminoimidazolecarboxamide formyltransferase/IMP cyclohydrolase [Candidatus Peregrinibacteria bacterium]